MAAENAVIVSTMRMCSLLATTDFRIDLLMIYHDSRFLGTERVQNVALL